MAEFSRISGGRCSVSGVLLLQTRNGPAAEAFRHGPSGNHSTAAAATANQSGQADLSISGFRSLFFKTVSSHVHAFAFFGGRGGGGGTHEWPQS